MANLRVKLAGGWVMTAEEAGAGPQRGRASGSGPEAAPGPDTGILITIRSLLPQLAPVERRVAQAVLDDPSGVAWRSISELAASCGTSATSVVRFCRAIGLRGYPDLRLTLAGAAAHQDQRVAVTVSSDINADDDPVTVIKKIAFADAAAVTDTASRLV